MILVASLVFTSASFAKDLGVRGKVFEITEFDIRIQMMMELSNNLSQEEFIKAAENESETFYTELKRHDLVTSRSHQVTHIDPTRVYEDDFWSFKETENGEFEWYKISESGASVNWLEHHQAPMQKFFIFDPNDGRQLEIARKLYELRNPYLTLVVIGGDMRKITEFIGGAVTYLNQDLIREYDLQFVPIVIRRGEGRHVNEYKKIRYNADDVKFEDVLSEVKGFSK